MVFLMQFSIKQAGQNVINRRVSQSFFLSILQEISERGADILTKSRTIENALEKN